MKNIDKDFLLITLKFVINEYINCNIVNKEDDENDENEDTDIAFYSKITSNTIKGSFCNELYKAFDDKFTFYEAYIKTLTIRNRELEKEMKKIKETNKENKETK